MLVVGLSGCIDGDDDHDHDHEDDHRDAHHDDADDDAQGGPEDHFAEIGNGSSRRLDRSTDPGETIADVHHDHWHGTVPTVRVGDSVSVGAAVEDEDDDTLEIGDDYDVRASVLVEGDDEFVSFDHRGDRVDGHGEAEGIAEIVFFLWHDDHVDYRTPPLTVQMTEE